ncbi:MAG: hypothetical protein P4M12_07685 [Gammaproteobacteria bacterium]|nr:hypothetical protein [Gammaproteobacteria bacterium]
MLRKALTKEKLAPPELPPYSSLAVRVITEAQKFFSSKKILQLSVGSSSCKENFSHGIHSVFKSHIYIARSPNHETFGHFIRDLAYNPNLSISHVIGMGLDKCDNFTDFCISNRDEILWESYKISVKNYKRLSDNIIQSVFSTMLSEYDLENAAFYYKNIHVKLLGLDETNSLQLASDTTHIMKDTLLQLLATHQPILIYSSLNKGCAAYLAFTFVLIENFSSIFEGGNPTVIAERIHSLFCEAYKNSSMTMEIPQYLEAIRNADILHRYAMAKGYMLENKIKHSVGCFNLQKEYFSAKTNNTEMQRQHSLFADGKKSKADEFTSIKDVDDWSLINPKIESPSPGKS